MALLVPHFDLPFRLAGKSFAAVEQDSHEDVANCVEVIVRTPLGFRDDNPYFGLTDQTFSDQPLNLEFMTAEIENQDPRASIVMEQNVDLLDQIVDNVKITVSS